MSKRAYTKKSTYWEHLSKSNGESETQPATPLLPVSHAVADTYMPALVGEGFNVSTASESTTATRRNAVTSRVKPNKYTNIWAGGLNYETGADGIDARDAIELCQRAYVNVAIFRLAIDTAAELANDKVFLKGGNAKSRKAVKAWFNRIGLEKMKAQYFREYYRGGNIFLYKLFGKFKADEYKKVVAEAEDASSVNNSVVMRYVLLNPIDIIYFHAASFDLGGYGKILNQYELNNLKNPQTEDERKILAGLPKDVQEQVKKGTFPRDGVKIKLDADKLVFSFYKKQDYEPFATPFGFPVLDDINFKLEMKKVDQAMMRTIDQMILLVTSGNTPDKGGVNKKALDAIKTIFENKSVGRFLVADYTTKAEFVIPDMNKVLGAEKYTVVNEDIKQGLNLVFLGDDKYGSAELKMEAFLDKLEEAQNDFLLDVLQPEVELFCKSIGLKLVPEVAFAKRTMKDESGFRKVIVRLTELGILTPDLMANAIDNGKMPTAEEIEAAQEKYVKDREDKKYNPLVGGLPAFEQEETAIIGGPKPKKSNRTPTANIPGDVGRPSKAFSLAKIDEVFKKVCDFNVWAADKYAATLAAKDGKKKKVSLSSDHKEMVSQLCASIVESKLPDDWQKSFADCLDDRKLILSLKVRQEVQDVADEHQMPTYAAALVALSNNNTNV